MVALIYFEKPLLSTFNRVGKRKKLRQMKDENWDIWLNQLHNKKSFSDFFYFLFVNWAGQMSAGQTGPKKSKIKSYKFLTFFIE